MSIAAKDLRSGWYDFFSSYEATHAVTVTYNPTIDFTVSDIRMRVDLDKLHLYVDDSLYGGRASQRPQERRCAFIGMIEHPDTNAHVHMLWRVPFDRHHKFDATIEAVWRRIRPSGTVKVRPDPDMGWGRYVLKDQWGAALCEAPHFIVSRSVRS